VTDHVHVKEMDRGKSREPQSYNCRPDGNNDLSNTSVFWMRRMTAPNAKALSKQTRKQDCAADNKSNPSHMANLFTLLIRRLGSTFLTKYS
jgi:hypothetical protein